MDITISWRNIWRNPRRTVIIMIAVIIGVWSMIFLTAFMRGMVVDMIDNGIATLTGDIKIVLHKFRSDPSLENRIRQPATLVSSVREHLPKGSRISTRVVVNAVAQNARHSSGVILAGINPKMEGGVSFIGSGVHAGEMIQQGDPAGILIGKALLDTFETKIGNKLILMSENTEHEIASRAFRIVGIYRAKLESTEKRYVFVSKAAAQEMLGIRSAISEISIVLQSHEQAGPVADKIAAAIDTDTYAVSTWKQLLPMLQAYIDIYDGFILLWYLVVFIAMAFGIINTTLMAVFERMWEFGLLKALGLRPWRILRSVLIESCIILLIGALAGNILAIAVLSIIGLNGIDLSAFATGFEYAGMSSIIYPEIFISDVILANVMVICLGLVVSAYPASRAARITPVQAMART
jgi:ABC-type lipoprotein release transport system permease subunit